jgi:peptide/nickel transport system substrate-binding protein
MTQRKRPPGLRRSVPVLFLAAGCALGVACGVVARDPEGLTVAVDSGPSSLDPRIGSDEASRRFNDLVFNSLFRTGDDARPVPDLAVGASWLDPRTLVVTLRPGVRFQDGALLEANDVLETYRSILEERVPSFRRADLEIVDTIEAPDPGTIVFRLKRPFAPFVANLTVPILRAAGGDAAARQPIGTGPFRLVRYRKDEDLLLERFDGYFEGRGALRTLRLRIIPAESSRLLELITGGVDLVVNDLSPDQFERIGTTPGFRVLARPGRNCVYLAFNLAHPALGDRRVRQAIAWSLDRDAIARHLLRGAATLASGLLPPGNWAYNPDVTTYRTDTSRAGTLLDEAGFPRRPGTADGIRLRLEYSTPAGELALQQAAIIQAQLAAVGIALDVRSSEWPTFYEDLRAGRFEMVLSNWTDIGDPDVYRLRFHSGERPPRGLNRGGYSNAEADRLIEEGALSTDEERRRIGYARLQALLAEDLPYIPLWHRHVRAALGPRIARFDLSAGADFRPLWRTQMAAPGGSGSGQPAAERGLEGARRDRPGPDESRGLDAEVEHRRGAAAAGGAAIEDDAETVADRLVDLGRRGGGRLARSVGAGGHDRAAHRQGEGGGDRVGRHPDPDGAAAAEEPRRELLRRRQDKSQRTRPEGVHQALRPVADLTHAEDHPGPVPGDEGQGHLVGAPLGLEDPVDRGRLTRVAGEPVEGLGRIADEEPFAEGVRGAGDDGRVGLVRIDAVDLGGHESLCLRFGGDVTIAQAPGSVCTRAPIPGLRSVA